MRNRTMLAAVATTLLFNVSPAFAEREDVNFDAFVKMCDADKDGMVSKQEVMKQVEKMFDRADTRKEGRLDKKQVEIFLRALMQQGG
jgi:hypothetical protein